MMNVDEPEYNSSKDPKNWILGVFYFSKEDKRLLPPKRISSLGWTVNFANPLSALVLIGVLFVILLLTKIA